MSLVFPHLDGFSATVESMLERFKRSVDLVDCGPVQHRSNKGSNSIRTYTLSLPKQSSAAAIRDSWKSDRRKLPRAGIVFPDGSILTVFIVWKSPPIPLSYQAVDREVQILDESSQLVGYVSEYSYCFYPNSRIADQIGYFRYDFHMEAMGDGDLGEHSHFHFHRSVGKEFRHATGPIFNFDSIVSGIEAVLARDTRNARLQKVFEQGDFQQLALDLTRDGIRTLAEKLLEKDRSRYPHLNKFESFMAD